MIKQLLASMMNKKHQKKKQQALKNRLDFAMTQNVVIKPTPNHD
ncbi:hypothetical protein [Photobacterium leiognathi]|nr:hypothetical protein [Photobacterium leiognathi]